MLCSPGFSLLATCSSVRSSRNACSTYRTRDPGNESRRYVLSKHRPCEKLHKPRASACLSMKQRYRFRCSRRLSLRLSRRTVHVLHVYETLIDIHMGFPRRRIHRTRAGRFRLVLLRHLRTSSLHSSQRLQTRLLRRPTYNP